MVELLRTDTRNVLLAAGLYCAHGVLFYAMTVYTLAYTTSAYGLAQNTYLIGVTAAGAVQLITIPLLGALSDKLGRRAVIMFGTLFIIAFAVPLNFLITSQVPVLMWLAVVIGICVGHNSVYSPTAALYSEMFPAHVRYSGASLGYQLGGAIAGIRPARRGFAGRRRGRRLLADCGADRARRLRRLRVHSARAPGGRGAGSAARSVDRPLCAVSRRTLALG